MKTRLVLLLAGAVACTSTIAQVPGARDTTATASEAGPAVDGFLLGDPPAVLYFDFDASALTDDGQDSDFWIDLVGQSFPATTVFPGVAPGGRATGGFANGSGNQDSSHPTVVMSSPSFQLVEDMAVNFIIAGGQGSAGAVAADLASVPANSSTTGFQGLALRRVSDGAYLLSARRAGNNNADQVRNFSRDQLNAIRLANPGEKFTLDWVDYYHGSWGFASIDEVSVTVGTPDGNIPLSNPVVTQGAGGYGTDINGILNDPFDYQPSNHSAVLPDLGFNGADGFHNNSSDGDAAIEIDVTTPFTVDAATSMAVDLYGRNSNQNRDDDVDVVFLDGSDAVLGQVTGLAIPNSAHLRVFSSSAGVADGSTIAKIRIVGHDSDGNAASTNNFTLMEVRAAAVQKDFFAAYVTGGNATNLGLETPTILAGAAGFGSTLAGTVNDGFAYNPNNPTAALPDQAFNGADGFHNNNTNTDASLLFDLTTPTDVGPVSAIFVDLYGRGDCCQVRDNDIDIAFLDASDTVLGELTGQVIPDAAPYHLRVSSAAAGVSGTVAKIRIIGHDSDGTPATTNSFTLMEVRAARVTPGYTNSKSVVEVNGAPANVGSQITLPSGALLTVSSNGKFTYDPNGVFDITAPAEGVDSFTYGMGYGTGTVSTGTVSVTITDADTVVYVDDDWAGTANGFSITDADLGTSGDQGATFGTDAFATVGAATAVAGPGSIIIVNDGTYAEAVGLSSGRILTITGADATASVTVDTLGVSGGAAVVINGDSSLTITTSSSVTGTDSLITLASSASVTCPTTGLSTGGSIALDDFATFSAGALTASGPGSVTLGGTSALTIDSGTLGASVTGTGSVTKNTTGQLLVQSDSTFDGGMVINGGRVQTQSSGALGVGVVTVNNSGQIFIVQNLTADVTIQGDGWTEGAGQLGAIRFNNGTTLTGDVTVDAAGARIVAYNGAVGNIDGDLLGGGNLEINFVANTTANGTVNLLGSGAASTSLVTVSRGRLNTGAALGGSVLVEDSGTLGGEGAITGSLQLGSTGSGGATLVIDADTAATLTCGDLLLEGVTNLNVTGTLSIGGAEEVLTYTGTLTDGNDGTLTDSFAVTGGGALRNAMVADVSKTLEISGDNEGMVFTATGGDDWQIGGPDNNWSSSDGFFFNGDTVTFNDTVAGTFGGTVTAAATVTPAATTFDNDAVEYTLVGAITGSGTLTKDGPGTVNLNSRQSFTGGTVVNGGVLNLAGGGGASGTIRGTVTVNSGAILRGSTGDFTGYANNPASLQTININGGEVNIAVINNQTLGSATINLTGGSLTGVDGSNLDFFQGGSAINVLASQDSSVISGTRLGLRQNGGIVFTVADGAAADDLVVDSVIQPRGTYTDNDVTKNGPGKMVLNATNTYTTKTIVNDGVLALGTNTAIPDGNTVDINGTGVLELAFSSGAEAVAVLNIDGIPVADGIYGATGSGADIIDDVHFSGPGRLLVGAFPYDTWEAFYGITGAGNGANSDTDTANNLLEFGFGTDPTVNDYGTLAYDGSTVTRGAPAIEVSFPGGGVDLSARFLRRKDHGIPGSASYTVQFSANMQDWEDSAETPTVVADDGDYELVEVPYPFFINGAQKARFFRVVVTAL